MRTEIITLQRPYLDDPAELARALEAWLEGDHSHFTDKALNALSKRANHRSSSWPKKRALLLWRVCQSLMDGMTINEATPQRAQRNLAYAYLKMLHSELRPRELLARVDDDYSDDDGTRA